MICPCVIAVSLHHLHLKRSRVWNHDEIDMYMDTPTIVLSALQHTLQTARPKDASGGSGGDVEDDNSDSDVLERRFEEALYDFPALLQAMNSISIAATLRGKKSAEGCLPDKAKVYRLFIDWFDANVRSVTTLANTMSLGDRTGHRVAKSGPAADPLKCGVSRADADAARRCADDVSAAPTRQERLKMIAENARHETGSEMAALDVMQETSNKLKQLRLDRAQRSVQVPHSHSSAGSNESECRDTAVNRHSPGACGRFSTLQPVHFGAAPAACIAALHSMDEGWSGIDGLQSGHARSIPLSRESEKCKIEVAATSRLCVETLSGAGAATATEGSFGGGTANELATARAASAMHAHSPVNQKSSVSNENRAEASTLRIERPLAPPKAEHVDGAALDAAARRPADAAVTSSLTAGTASDEGFNNARVVGTKRARAVGEQLALSSTEEPHIKRIRSNDTGRSAPRGGAGTRSRHITLSTDKKTCVGNQILDTDEDDDEDTDEDEDEGFARVNRKRGRARNGGNKKAKASAVEHIPIARSHLRRPRATASRQAPRNTAPDAEADVDFDDDEGKHSTHGDTDPAAVVILTDSGSDISPSHPREPPTWPADYAGLLFASDDDVRTAITKGTVEDAQVSAVRQVLFKRDASDRYAFPPGLQGTEHAGAWATDYVTYNKLQTLAPGQCVSDEPLNFLRSKLNSENKATYSAFRPSVESSDSRRLGVDASSVAQSASGLGARGIRGQGARAHCWSTFFFTQLTEKGRYNYLNVSGWTAKARLDDELSMIRYWLTPLHVRNRTHWALAALDTEAMELHYFDAFYSSLPPRLIEKLKYVLQWYSDLIWSKTGKRIDTTKWRIMYHTRQHAGIPTQHNTYDCGIFMIHFIRCIMTGKEWDFSQDDINRLRLQLIYDILKS